MSIDVSWSAFKNFANADGRGADSTEVATFLGGKNVVSLSDNRVGGNAACSIGKRTADAKARNNQTRAALICALLKAYEFDDLNAEAAIDEINENAKNGNWTIDQKVLDKIAETIGSDNDGLSLKDFNCGKPLTARRIKKIEKAIVDAIEKNELKVVEEDVVEEDDNNECNHTFDNISASALEDVDDAPGVVQNPYLQKCLDANDIDGLLANVSMAFAWSGAKYGENLDVSPLCRDSLVALIAEKCLTFGEKGIAAVRKYCNTKIRENDSDRHAFHHLRDFFMLNSNDRDNKIAVAKLRYDALKQYNHNAEYDTAEYIVSEVLRGDLKEDHSIRGEIKADNGNLSADESKVLNKIEGYLNSDDNKKEFVSSFAGSLDNKPDEDIIAVVANLLNGTSTITDGEGKIYRCPELIREEYSNVMPGQYFMRDAYRGHGLTVVSGEGNNKITNELCNGETKPNVIDVAKELVAFFKDKDNKVQLVSLGRFILLANQQFLTPIQAAVSYRGIAPSGDNQDMRGDRYQNAGGLIPFVAVTSDIKLGSHPIFLIKDGDNVIFKQIDCVKGEGSHSHSDGVFFDIAFFDSDDQPKHRMEGAEHTITVAITLGNGGVGDEGIKVKWCVASAKYKAKPSVPAPQNDHL